MPTSMRPYYGESDTPAVLALRRRCTTPENVTDYPSLTDLHELLNPLRSQQHTSIRLWEDETGLIVAYAHVHFPYCNLYFLIDPAYWQTSIKEEIITYACEVMHRFNQENGEERTLDANCRDTDEQKLHFLLRAGFVRQPIETPILVRSLREPFPEPLLPPGFHLRHITGEHEVEQCVELHRAAFGTQKMTVENRLSIMREPDYDPEGDLVIEAPDGTMVAYTICAIHPEENAQSGRNRGYIDPIGVYPSFQRRGLGTAVMLAGLRYLKERGGGIFYDEQREYCNVRARCGSWIPEAL
jgi:mycothiol synthase